MAEADRPTAPGQAARTGESRLAVRLQLRRAQPVATASADRAKTTGNAQGAVRLKNGRRPEMAIDKSAKAA